MLILILKKNGNDEGGSDLWSCILSTLWKSVNSILIFFTKSEISKHLENALNF